MVQEQVLDPLRTAALKVFVVWAPVLKTDTREAAAQATRLIPDLRARHYWDSELCLGRRFADVVPLPRKGRLAWDVYFGNGADAQWKEAPPMPAAWMHQLSRGRDPRLLDGAKLRAEIQTLLEKAR